MNIAFITSDKSGDQVIAHDLNFQSEHYESKHTIVNLPIQCQTR
jgi:transcription initiation factor IIF auxiliary subunit